MVGIIHCHQDRAAKGEKMKNTVIAAIGGIIVGALAGTFVLSPFFHTSPLNDLENVAGTSQDGRGFTGMQVQGMTPKASKALGQSQIQGVLVRDVGLGSPADKAGINRGDLIVQFNGQAIDTFNQLIASVGKVKAGDKAAIVVRRGNQEKTLTLRAGGWPASLLVNQSTEAQIKEIGISFASISQKVRNGFGLRWGTTGVVVTKMDEGLNKSVGLKAGEVILQVNQRDVWSPQHVVSEIRKAKAAKRDSVLLLVESSKPGRNGYRFTLLPIK